MNEANSSADADADADADTGTATAAKTETEPFEPGSAKQTQREFERLLAQYKAEEARSR